VRDYINAEQQLKHKLNNEEGKRTFIRKFDESNHFIMKTVENATEELFSIFLLSMLSIHTSFHSVSQL